eukprot:scaffold1099_cov143-Skeletonema_dohrnii-CCMP3373.AAC.3
MAKKKSATRNAQPTKQSEAPLNNKSGPDRSFPQTLLNDKHTNRQSLHLEDLIPNAVFVARNALSSKECEDWIKYAENSGYDTVAHPATKWIAHRECSRLQKNDWTMAHRLFGRIQQVVAEASKQLDIFDKSTRVNSSYANKSYQPITCNPNLRLYKYTKGQWFGKHIDDTNKIEWRGEDTPYAAKDVAETHTEITVLFYLSSCKGGATRFHLPKSTKKKGRGDDGSVAFTPTQGAVLLHVHGDNCLEHEAEPVIDGIKYVLRTDIVYGIM